MRGRGWLVIGMVGLWSTLPASAALAAHGGTWHVVERVSVASDGSQANSYSYDAAVSGDGRIVAFTSDADNLVPGDSNDTYDVFVHDRATGRTRRVNVASDGSQANRRSYSYEAAVSGDGRTVAFGSDAGNLVPGDDNNSFDVFVHDRATGRTRRVSVASDGSQANSHSYDAAVSGDGRIVAFRSDADNLVPGDSNDASDVFVHDRATGRTRRVNVASDGSQANSHSYDAAVSGDGRIVAFTSFANNLVVGDSNNRRDVFVHDRATGRTERVNVASDGSQANRRSYSYEAAVSGDGRTVAFESDAGNLVPGDDNNSWDVFVHDRATGRTERVNVASDGSQANHISSGAAVSGDGRTVAFRSYADNLVPGDSNNWGDVFVAERAASGPVCTVTGSAGDDVLIGTAGDDVLCGRGGDDRLLGRGGDDILRGGRGGDRLRGGFGADRLRGGRGPDRLYGGYGPDRLYGGYGDDVLRGGPGPDRLRGGPGDDLLFGGPGDDRLRGNRGVDLLPERHD